MDISLEEIKRLEKLTAIHSSDEDLQSMAKDFNQIAEFVEQIKNADIDDIEVTARILRVDELRKDEIKESLPQTEILANAPEQGEGAFVVPKVVE